jgi:flagellar protein FlbD
MITLTKLNDQRFALNYHKIETIQENPDTTIKLSNGNTYIVKESLEEIVNMIYRNEKGIRRA